jgi:cytochrome c553
MLETLVRRLNMVRLTALALAFVALTLGGCTGLIDDGNGGLTMEEVKARKMWVDKASPVLMTSCIGCHAGQRPNTDFLAGTEDLEIRARMITFTPAVINLSAPQSSRILTKGPHEGPSLTATETSDVLEWIRAEKDAQPDPGETDPAANLETTPFIPAICTSGTPPSPTCPTNDIDLTEVGLPGAKLHFVATALGSGLYLNQLSIIPGPDGVYLEHPLFASYPDGESVVPDEIDRFYNVKLNLMGNATGEQIQGGYASFPLFKPNAKISVLFKIVKAYQPETPGGPGGGGGGGCKKLDDFKTSARALFAQPAGGAAQSCLSCHGGQNGNATSAMNITGVNAADDPTIQLACNQILTRANLTTPDQSGVFLAPDPGNNNHPFRFTAAQLNTFKNGPPGTGVLGWINLEKVAP